MELWESIKTTASKTYERLTSPAKSTTETSSNVEKKTKKPEIAVPTEPPKIQQNNLKNVLDSYRTYTYNFTLAALRKGDVENPETYRSSALDLIILKSGGKGIFDISNPDKTSSDYSTANMEVYDAKDAAVKRVATENVNNNTSLISGFNQYSPGRFDLFIENVEIETIMQFTEAGGTTLPTGIKFDIIEPYSINGFIEALQVTAVAAGYPTYAQASYILKLEFWGYPDNASTPNPMKIPNTERYFVFRFSGVEVDVSERGTLYRCAGVPFDQGVFGQPSVLKKSINMAGSTVSEILTDLMSNVTKQTKDDDAKAKGSSGAKNYDEYEIKFPTVGSDGTLDFNKINEIGLAKVDELLKSSAIYQFPDPGENTKPTAQKAEGVRQPTAAEQTSAPETIKLHPSSGTPPQVQFAEKQRLNEIIAALIVDSKYIREKLQKLDDPKVIDEYGFFDYFLITSKIQNKEEIDPASRKPYQKYTFIVTPYKVHYTKIPSLQGQQYNADKLKSLSIREYNYLYTGQNVDILNFKLNFNNLYFEAIPVAMGNSDSMKSATTAGKANESQAVRKGDNVENIQNNGTPVPTSHQTGHSVVETGVSGGQPQRDSYYALARNMHKAVVDSRSNMLTGEIEVIGDPMYVVTGGIGNYTPKTISRTITRDNEAAYLNGQVLITINFRNPVDINPLSKGGRYFFDAEKVPFSGVYAVNKVVSIFNEGVFKQRLDIMRMPGQIISNVQPTAVKDSVGTAPNPLDQVSENTSVGENTGGRPQDMNVLLTLGRGIASPGLPGELSNFTNAVGGLGGTAQSLMNQVSGAVTSGINKLTSADSIFGAALPAGASRLSSEIRLKTSGLVDTLQGSLGSAAALVQTATTLKNGTLSENLTQQLSKSIQTQADAVKNQLSVPGSGIGEGATVLINDAKSQLTNLSSVGQNLSKITDDAMAKVQFVSKNASELVSGIGDKVSSLQLGTSTDPTAIASKFGINVSQLSGLSDNLKSKVVGQLQSLAEKVPENTNLLSAMSSGLSVKYLSLDKLANLPATNPLTTAPAAAIDGKLSEVANNISETVNTQFTKDNPVDANVMADKLMSAKSQLSSVIGTVGSVESKILSVTSGVSTTLNNVSSLSNSVTSKFGSLSKGSSPLDKLIS